MAQRFADNYFGEPWRGYGLEPPRIFRLLRHGEAWDKVASHIYPGGSFGNGAAMRVKYLLRKAYHPAIHCKDLELFTETRKAGSELSQFRNNKGQYILGISLPTRPEGICTSAPSPLRRPIRLYQRV